MYHTVECRLPSFDTYCVECGLVDNYAYPILEYWSTLLEWVPPNWSADKLGTCIGFLRLILRACPVNIFSMQESKF